MTMQSQVQKASLGKIIEMFEIDTSVIGGSDHMYFCNSSDSNSMPLLWQSITYEPWPIEAKGFEKSTRGTLPRPTIQVGNVGGVLSALLRAYDDLVGAKVIRRRTLEMFLDGRPAADPTQHYDDDIFFVERKISELPDSAEFELASAMDLHGVQLPGRTIIAGSCPSEYRGEECSYTGTLYFDVLNNPVATLAEDVCSKSPTGCKRRFGEHNRLPFGGFPGARIYKS